LADKPNFSSPLHGHVEPFDFFLKILIQTTGVPKLLEAAKIVFNPLNLDDERHRQTTEGQRDRQTGIHTYIQTDRQTDGRTAHAMRRT